MAVIATTAVVAIEFLSMRLARFWLVRWAWRVDDMLARSEQRVEAEEEGSGCGRDFEDDMMGVRMKY